MSGGNRLKCRVAAKYPMDRAPYYEDAVTVVEYEIDGTIADANIITMMGCGAMFLAGLTLDGSMTITFEAKSGKRWKTIAHWED